MSIDQLSGIGGRALLGSIAADGEPYFPPDLVGGVCPRIVGEEDHIVWNAAAQACGSERVHTVWRAVGDHIWYLAVRSSDLASRPHSWCPLAALLPMVGDIESLPVCYIYYGDAEAILMVLTTSDLQIFRGTALSVRAKAERTSRELENAQLVTLEPVHISQMAPIPWRSLSLFEDRARRVVATVAVFAALLVAGLSLLVWAGASVTAIAVRHGSLGALGGGSIQLMQQAESLRISPLREQIAEFMKVNDGLLAVDGFMNVYEIDGGNARWRATVPGNVAGGKVEELGGQVLDIVNQDYVVVNDAEKDFELQVKQ